MAAVASAVAVDVSLTAAESNSPETNIRNCHAAMNGTRGAVIAVPAMDLEAGARLPARG